MRDEWGRHFTCFALRILSHIRFTQMPVCMFLFYNLILLFYMTPKLHFMYLKFVSCPVRFDYYWKHIVADLTAYCCGYFVLYWKLIAGGLKLVIVSSQTFAWNTLQQSLQEHFQYLKYVFTYLKVISSYNSYILMFFKNSHEPCKYNYPVFHCRLNFAQNTCRLWLHDSCLYLVYGNSSIAIKQHFMGFVLKNTYNLYLRSDCRTESSLKLSNLICL